MDPTCSLTTGVYASFTAMTRPAPTSGWLSNLSTNLSKNASRVQCFGATST